MKICHCVKLTDEERKAFDTVCNVLDEMENDSMLTNSFDNWGGIGFCDIRSWLNEVMTFIDQIHS